MLQDVPTIWNSREMCPRLQWVTRWDSWNWNLGAPCSHSTIIIIYFTMLKMRPLQDLSLFCHILYKWRTRDILLKILSDESLTSAKKNYFQVQGIRHQHSTGKYFILQLPVIKYCFIKMSGKYSCLPLQLFILRFLIILTTEVLQQEI